MRLFLILIALLYFGTSPAFAGAWTQEAGGGIFILTGSYYRTDQYFDNDTGDRRKQPTYQQYDLNPYVEYGVWDATTVGANLSLQDISQNNPPPSRGDERNWGLGDSEFFLRQQLWKGYGFSLSAEPTIKLPSPESNYAYPKLGSDHGDAAIGLNGGYGFEAFGQHHYIDIDNQYRYRFGSPKDQLRLNATAGIGVTDRWTIMPQAYLTWRLAQQNHNFFTESDADDYNMVKLQLSALYALNQQTSVQFGGFSNVAGRNSGAGEGVLLALWRRF